jgi:dienelactone hydrolase
MTSRTGLLIALLIVFGGCAATGDRPEPATSRARVERLKITTLTITNEQFLRGAGTGRQHVITGDLERPDGTATRAPAVVLMHGGSGVLDYQLVWARELRSVGFATLVVDSFSGRGLARIAHDQEALNVASRVIDAYRALGALASHPKIDRSRIAFMGFSHGATAGLYASRQRFQNAWAPRDAEFALWILFYPYCNTRLVGELEVSRPLRIFHGAADDWTPIGPCRDYVERLRAAGRDATLTEYALARHGFDDLRAAPLVRIADAMNPSGCFFVESEGGVVLNRETGKPMTYRDACWTRGVTAGYDSTAYANSVAAVKQLLGALARSPR